MQYTILAPQKLDATITLPASKSISNRALIIHALSGSSVLPENLSDCDDTDVIIAALRDMPYEINIKAAGTAMRFMTAFLSQHDGEHIITGTERMRHRPISILVDALRQLGADIEYAGEEGYPPLLIHGRKLQGGLLEIPGNVSSQYISALLMLGPMLAEGLHLHLTGTIISRPYIDMTLGMMGEFGAKAAWQDECNIIVEPIPYVPRPYLIESDWSAASYWYQIEALAGPLRSHIICKGLFDKSWQGDAVVKDIFQLLMSTNHVSYDFSGCPDLAQTIVCTCCAMGKTFHFTGLSTLKIKETDRIEALKRELYKLGFVLEDRNDSELLWDGTRCKASMQAIDTYEDHRMAMAFAPLSINFPKLKINDPHVVSKSYPRYWDDLKRAGFTIIETTEGGPTC